MWIVTSVSAYLYEYLPACLLLALRLFPPDETECPTTSWMKWGHEGLWNKKWEEKKIFVLRTTVHWMSEISDISPKESQTQSGLSQW